mgnify:CR=1 FL=1
MNNIFERILQEASKYRFLEPLYNTYSSKINNCPSFDEILKYVDTNNMSFDWQNKDKEKLFNTIVDSYIQYKQKGGSIKDRKQDAKNLFLDKFTTDKPGNAWDYNFFLHNDLETEDYIFLSVLSYDAAKYCDSFECGGEGAKWCIGYEKDDGYWKNYVDDNRYLFVLAFNKKEYANKKREKNKLKYMLAFDPESIEESKAWVQDDNETLCIPCTEWKHKFGRSFNEILKSIDNADVISAVHFEEDGGEFFTSSPWVKSSLFDKDHVYENMYMTTEEMWFPNFDNGGLHECVIDPRVGTPECPVGPAGDGVTFGGIKQGGSPWSNDPKAIRHYGLSPHKLVTKWHTPLMVIHGGMDYRVPVDEGMAAYNAAQMMGVPSRLLIFPDENHWILKPQNAMLWHREYFRWLEQWCK